MLYNGLSLSIITADSIETNDITVSSVLTRNLDTTGKLIWRKLVFKEDNIILWLNFNKLVFLVQSLKIIPYTKFTLYKQTLKLMKTVETLTGIFFIQTDTRYYISITV